MIRKGLSTYLSIDFAGYSIVSTYIGFPRSPGSHLSGGDFDERTNDKAKKNRTSNGVLLLLLLFVRRQWLISL